MNNLTNSIIAYECGELNEMECIELFSQLVANGMAWSLQGHYGRTASRLIEVGVLSKDGSIDHELLNNFA